MRSSRPTRWCAPSNSWRLYAAEWQRHWRQRSALRLQVMHPESPRKRRKEDDIALCECGGNRASIHSPHHLPYLSESKSTANAGCETEGTTRSTTNDTPSSPFVRGAFARRGSSLSSSIPVAASLPLPSSLRSDGSHRGLLGRSLVRDDSCPASCGLKRNVSRRSKPLRVPREVGTASRATDSPSDDPSGSISYTLARTGVRCCGVRRGGKGVVVVVAVGVVAGRRLARMPVVGRGLVVLHRRKRPSRGMEA